MTTIFGAIADDFTGASDLAGLLARSGHQVCLRLGVPSSPPMDSSAFEIIALKCRTAPVDEAVSESLAALDWLKAAGVQHFFWKYCSTFDSTPAGNIGPVAEALMAALDTDQTIYCPAFPENGRSIFMGNLFVGRQLLSESPMKHHPLTPMTDSNLMRLLAPQTTAKVGLADRLVVAQGEAHLKAHLAKLQDDDIAHVVVDAVANADLEIIARAYADAPLMTGGSAVAMALPHIYQEKGLLPDTPASALRPHIDERTLILSGSCSEMTQAQVAAYDGPAYQLDPLELQADGLAKAQDWLSRQKLADAPLLYATAAAESVQKVQQRLGRDEAGALVEAALSQLAEDGFNRGVRRFIIAGGETSGAVAQRLNIDQLVIGDEIAPGVPWCYADIAGQHCAITLKSGNFGQTGFFSDAINRLS